MGLEIILEECDTETPFRTPFGLFMPLDLT
jgi:hypothetical protein